MRFIFCPRGCACATSLLLSALAVLSMFSTPAAAVTLTHNNSSIKVNPTLRAGISDWTVDGVDHLVELSNWYRVGPAGREQSVHTISAPVTTLTGANSMRVSYSNPTFTIAFDYGVTGGALGSGYSRMGETVHITNHTRDPLEFHFFEYVDLDLTNMGSDDEGIPLNSGALRQTDPFTIVNAGFLNYDHHEWDFFNSTLTHLSDGSTSTLNGNPPFGTPFGTGNVTWALQWDFVGSSGIRPEIPSGHTVTITKNLECMPVPEPSVLLLGALGVVGLLMRRRAGR